jgi:hypothetical protein
MDPDLVVATSLPDTSPEANPADDLPAITSYLDRLAQASAHVLVISAPPGASPVATCKKVLAGPWSCLGPLHDAAATAWRTTLRTAAAAAHVPWVDSEDWMCVAGACPPFIDGALAYFDWWHYTAAMSAKLGRVLGFEIHRRLPDLPLGYSKP